MFHYNIQNVSAKIEALNTNDQKPLSKRKCTKAYTFPEFVLNASS